MIFLVNQLEQLFISLIGGPVVVKVLITLLILFLGFLIARGISRIITAVNKRRSEEDIVKKIKKGGKPARTIEYVIIILTIITALIYLNASLTNQMLSKIVNYTPTLISTILIIILGVIVTNFLVGLLKGFFETFKFKEYIERSGLSPKIFDSLMIGLKIFLYIVVLEIAITQLGISMQLLSNTLTAASYAIVFLLALLGFFGFKDLVENYAAGIYLKSSRILKPGERIKISDETGEIRDISSFGTTVDTASGYFMLIPNKSLMNREVMFKRTKAEVSTLEDIKEYFQAEDPSYCGPASAEMALAMFGFDFTQGDIAEMSETEKGEDIDPEKLGSSVERLTKNEVKSAFVDFDKITNLGDELKAWLNDGALPILQFLKPVIFPESTSGHYVLCAGVEGNEILAIDPSSQTGGVYYVDQKDMLRAMSEYEGKKGYTVLAPRGTTAYWRIKQDLIFSHPNFYEKLSKSLEVQLSKILRRSRILKNVTPKAVEDFIKKWRTEEKIHRMWRPEKEETGEKSLEEFTKEKGGSKKDDRE